MKGTCCSFHACLTFMHTLALHDISAKLHTLSKLMLTCCTAHVQRHTLAPLCCQLSRRQRVRHSSCRLRTTQEGEHTMLRQRRVAARCQRSLIESVLCCQLSRRQRVWYSGCRLRQALERVQDGLPEGRLLQQEGRHMAAGHPPHLNQCRSQAIHFPGTSIVH